MLDISVNPGLLRVHADLDCIINRPEILINQSRREHAYNNKINSHRFTGTKMFNRQAGDGLILVVGMMGSAKPSLLMRYRELVIFDTPKVAESCQW
jgi:hypothetical protein